MAVGYNEFDMLNPDVLQESEIDQGDIKNSREHNEPQILNFNPRTQIPATTTQRS